MSQETKEAKLVIDGKEVASLPIYEGTIGPSVIDITKLYSTSGHFTFDPGFMSTGSCSSKITYIDGEQGILMHRGYRIEDLAEHCSFLEVAHLLLEGELPNEAERDEFENQIKHHSMVHEQLHFLYRGFPRRSHPMAIMVGAFSSLSSCYHDSLDIYDPKQREVSALRMIAKAPTLGAMAYKYSIGQPFMHPQNKHDFASNFLHMMFGVPAEEYEVNPIIAKAINKIFILHADHEQNASTSTVRLAGSSGANPFACIGAGIASLWGPAHGGANEAVINMLDEIGETKNIPKFIEKAKDKNDPFKLMGFGHRVYKNHDPRATVLRSSCHAVLQAMKANDHQLEIAMKLEEIALKDEYFIERKLFPNVDFYSGIIYRALNIPPQMFTVLFAIARTAGWVAQWKEMMEDPSTKIGRPRQLYTGHTERKFIKISGR